MILDTTYIRPIKLRKVSAFEKARLHYLSLPQSSDPQKQIRLEDDILWCFYNGWLHASPTSFALACIINIAPENTNLVEPAWFIRYAIGDLYEILNLLPGKFQYIVWCRDNEDEGRKLRKYRTDRLFAIAKGKLRVGRTDTPNNNKPNVRLAGSTPAPAASVSIGG